MLRDAPVTATLGPTGPLLRQLQSLVASERGRPKGVNLCDFESLKNALEQLWIDLMDPSDPESAVFSLKVRNVFMAMWWTKQVRELFYDTEDQFNELMQSGASKSMGSISWFHRNLQRRRPQIAKDFSQIVDRVKGASERSQNLELFAPKTIQPDFGEASVSRLSAELSLEPSVSAAPTSVRSDTSGHSGFPRMDDLLKLLAFDDEKEKQLRVVSILGASGVGKTKVAMTLYQRHKDKFHCRAFLRASRDPDMRRLLASMLSQIKAPPANPFSDVQDLTGSITKHLQGKRYLIIIDDIWTTPVWGIIIRSLAVGDYCSRIITTTQIKDVALACCNYDTRNIFSITPPEVSGSKGDPTTPSPEGIQEALKHIYNNLPPHLKTCLLYLSAYPVGYTIWKDDLVKQWVAEGFVIFTQGQDTEDTAGAYFDDLVSRGMIQLVDTGYKGEVLCTVHNTVLDLIRCKSMEENFIIIVDNSQSTPWLHDKVRRLSVQFGGAKGAKIPERIVVSQVRSLIFSGFINCVPSIEHYKFLRVLSLYIWYDQGKKSFDLNRIRQLLWLRYLKIECNNTIKLPAGIPRLQYLGTLEVDAGLSVVPSDIVHSRSLSHLRLPNQAKLPAGIGRMISLRSLGYFNLSNNSRDNVLGLGKLVNLQDLRLTCSKVQSSRLVGNIKHLGSILGEFGKLKSLILDSGASSESISCDGLSSVSKAPSLLERLKFPQIFIFSSLPKWFGDLNKLCVLKFAVEKLSTEDTDILGGLPSLTALSLNTHIAPTGQGVVFGQNGFTVLRHFKFTCPALCLAFEERAMPNVESLKLRFKTFEQSNLASAGFDRLAGLKKISVKIGSVTADDPGIKAALTDVFSKHRHANVEQQLAIQDPSREGTSEQADSGTFVPSVSPLHLQISEDTESDALEAARSKHPSTPNIVNRELAERERFHDDQETSSSTTKEDKHFTPEKQGVVSAEGLDTQPEILEVGPSQDNKQAADSRASTSSGFSWSMIWNPDMMTGVYARRS